VFGKDTSNLNAMGKSPLILAALAKAAVPSLTFTSVKKLSAGGTGLFDSALLTSTTGEHFVARTPQSRAGALELDVETQVLRTLGSSVRAKLPFKITSQMGETKDARGARVVLFEFLYGNPIDPARVSASSPLAGSIGSAIAAIHALDTEAIRAAGLPEFSAAELVKKLVNELDEVAATGEIPSTLLSRWESALEDVSLFRYQPTVVHGELSADTVLELDGQVSAVLNWGALHLGDPAQDLTWLASSVYGELFDAVMLSYSKTSGSSDSGLKQRAALYNELAHARWLLLCLKKQDDAAIADARAEISYLAQDLEDGILPALTASAFVSAAAAGAFISAEEADAPSADEPQEPVDDQAFQSFAEPVQESAQDGASPESSTETAPISQVEIDDKTREIELPDKTDNELF
jgi:aminoglycoside phosphotransferase (APT) family kinase protein